MVNKDKWYIEVHELMDLLASNDYIVNDYREGNPQAMGLVALALMRLKTYEYDELKKNIDDDEDNIQDRKNFLNNLKSTVKIYENDSPDSSSFQILNALLEETIVRLKKLGEETEAIEIIYTYLSNANSEWREMNRKIAQLGKE